MTMNDQNEEPPLGSKLLGSSPRPGTSSTCLLFSVTWIADLARSARSAVEGKNAAARVSHFLASSLRLVPSFVTPLASVTSCTTLRTTSPQAALLAVVVTSRRSLIVFKCLSAVAIIDSQTELCGS
jgi:hypothetical protein